MKLKNRNTGLRDYGTLIRRVSSADCQSAVSQDFNLQAAGALANDGSGERADPPGRPQMANLRCSRLEICATPEASAGHAARRSSRDSFSQRGIALVITLIMLAVITFMAVAFLVLTRGQRSNVTTFLDQAQAKMAADAALDRAQTELIAAIMASGSEFDYGLAVSTNYINAQGFNPALPANANRFTNVSYTYASGLPLNQADLLNNLENLLIDPRPPVFIATNRLGSNEFRFYYDVNRNRRYDPSGVLPVIGPGGTYYDLAGNPIPTPIPGNTLSGFFVGDPEWIGGLEYPDRPHSATNRFLYRFAYFVVPVGKTLDVNYIHNYTKIKSAVLSTSLGDGFFRNQGVGPWEINLAAFLVDLNTNRWPTNSYQYNWKPNVTVDFMNANLGNAFDDALGILSYRYNWNTNTLASVSGLFGNAGVRAFTSDFVDGYSSGPLMLGTWWPQDSDALRVNRCWPGAPNTNHYFTSPQDLLDNAKVGGNPPLQPSFATQIAIATTNVDSYNRYTLSRLLSQLGTDSAPEPAGTVNLNYDNLTPTNGIASVTNFLPWTPVNFFTNSAQAMLASAGYANSVLPTSTATIATNVLVTDPVSGKTHLQIQVYPTNYYSSSLHRLLQVAANIYDATTNRPYNGYVATNGFPSVFRPIFRYDVLGRVFIVNYQEVTNTDLAYSTTNSAALVDFDSGQNTNKFFGVPAYRIGQPVNNNEPIVAGYPLVVGARKGFPNFNNLAMQTEVKVTRKLEFLKHNVTDERPYITNQMYLLSISNSFGVDAWNSYHTAYPRNLQMIIGGDMTCLVTNEFGVIISNLASIPFSNYVTYGASPIIGGNQWSGWDERTPTRNAFRAPFYPGTNHFFFLPQASYNQIARGRQGALTVPYQTNFIANARNPFVVPHWSLVLRARLRFILVDTDAKRIVDYVNLASKDAPVDLAAALTEGGSAGEPWRPDCHIGSMWVTNRGGTNLDLLDNRPTYGILNQIDGSLNTNTAGLNWIDAGGAAGGPTVQGAQNFFRTNLMKWPPNGPQQAGAPLYLTNRFYAPYAPTRSVYVYTSWSANDPLVHYTVGDLMPLIRTNRYEVDLNPSSPIGNIGGLNVANIPVGKQDPVNSRYEPWGGYQWGASSSTNKYTVSVKDPLVGRSEDWDFPTNKFANVGWLGRVHRGTPWQTIYLKSPSLDVPAWALWSGNGQMVTNFGQLDRSLLAITNWVPDAVFSMPTNDWRLLDVFSTAFYENSALGKLDVNQSGLAAWSAVLSGVAVVTNTTPDATFQVNAYSAALYDVAMIGPAGYYNPFGAATNLPPVARIVNALNVRRASLTNQHQAFQHLGDILAVPELTVASPFLNTSTDNLRQHGISEAAYERIPQQIVGLLKCDHTPRFVVYSYGQTLRPAEHSLVTSGTHFNLCTNYQITAETATRTVIRVEGAPGQPHAIIESFNALPPD